MKEEIDKSPQKQSTTPASVPPAGNADEAAGNADEAREAAQKEVANLEKKLKETKEQTLSQSWMSVIKTESP